MSFQLQSDFGWNISRERKIRSPITGMVHTVRPEHYDVVLDDSIVCPYSGDYMQLYNPNATNLGVRMSAMEYVEWNKRYFMECPSANCSYLKQYGTSFKQDRVYTDLLVQSFIERKPFRTQEPPH